MCRNVQHQSLKKINDRPEGSSWDVVITCVVALQMSQLQVVLVACHAISPIEIPPPPFKKSYAGHQVDD